MYSGREEGVLSLMGCQIQLYDRRHLTNMLKRMDNARK